ncbi:MAG: glycosyltransferase family 4 protein [Verrucomicrobiota bacterium]|nr:glycosyltransferase family 4 protein [Verrucomicrobiota bacterium]
MRVLLITDWNRGQGGAENYIASLRDGLRAAGDEVRLLTSSAGSAGNGQAEHVAFGTNHLAAQTVLQIANPFAAALVRRVRAEMRPEVALVNMFAHHLSPSVLTALEGVPTVLLVSDYKCICPIGSKLLPNDSLCNVKAGWNCCRNGCVNPIHWVRDQPRYGRIRAGVRRVARVLACSEYVKQELARNGIGSEVEKLPVPAPMAKFHRQPARDPVFVFYGRLEREKGVDLLLRAFAQLCRVFPKARLRIIGHGLLWERLETIAAELGLTSTVEFFGWLSMTEIEEKLHDAWAVVVPSLWAEPLGLVAIEAIVRGVPVIASKIGGLAEIVEEGVSGLLFQNNSEVALLECLSAIASRRAFPTQTLPDGVVSRAQETFSMEGHVEVVRKIFTEVTSSSRIKVRLTNRAEPQTKPRPLQRS